MKVTELDIWTADEKLQADYFRDFYTLVYSYPAFEAIISWGFWENSHWRPDAAWYRKDFSIKPVGEVHKELVYDKWWTNETGVTNANGKYTLRGYEGKYVARVIVGNKVVEQAFTLDNKGNSVEIILK